MPRAHDHCTGALIAFGFLVVALTGCSSTGDLGQLQPSLVTDDIHAWVGRDAARAAGAPVSHNELTDDERTLRDLAFPLIEPPYDRQRWDAVVYEYGINRLFDRTLWIDNPTLYYRHLEDMPARSVASRYNQLIDDIRNDIVRIEPFFVVARRVVDLDRRRAVSMRHIDDLSPADRHDALARIGENRLTIAWVEHSLAVRCAGYQYALDHLAVADPEPLAAEANMVLGQLKQRIAAFSPVPPPHFAQAPFALAASD